ncbi:Ly6/PLAUR domain-containing protein 1 [Holothuria leucospilota]|uniref:Ly6/PLAUR domain-containing protein 1 n=1 Tax=Holothuria leucospilota TaxID=206669 RepID=A0A9Q1CIB5_HOLLE|nr:Ly6/PLAUR domain-containing protein 1 [Holothuria leucospilota]
MIPKRTGDHGLLTNVFPRQLTILFVLSLSWFQFGHGLQCYSCSKEDSNQYCIGTDHIQSCSRNQDRCLTQTIYSEERGKLRIDKYCASEAGCLAATEQLGKLYYCDKSRKGWGCVECCEGELCNISRGDQIKGVGALWISCFSYAVYRLMLR